MAARWLRLCLLTLAAGGGLWASGAAALAANPLFDRCQSIAGHQVCTTVDLSDQSGPVRTDHVVVWTDASGLNLRCTSTARGAQVAFVVGVAGTYIPYGRALPDGVTCP